MSFSRPPLKVLKGGFSIHRLRGPDLPHNVLGLPFFWIGKTDEELSLVCDSKITVNSENTSSGWSCIKVLGPLAFEMTGIIASLSKVLADEDISIFAISTFDTDYLLLKDANLSRGLAALETAGYDVEK